MDFNKIVEYYNYLDMRDNNPVINYCYMKKMILYIMTLMNENLLNIITGIATGFSINLFTNFVTVDSDLQVNTLIVWFIRFFAAIIFNVCIIRLTILCTLLRSRASDEADDQKPVLVVERELFYRKALVSSFERDYKTIKLNVIVGILSLVVLIGSNIIYPLFIFLIHSRNKVEDPAIIETLSTKLYLLL